MKKIMMQALYAIPFCVSLCGAGYCLVVVAEEIINTSRNRITFYHSPCKEYTTIEQARRELEEEKTKIGLESEVEIHFQEEFIVKNRVGNENFNIIWESHRPISAEMGIGEDGIYNIYLGELKNRMAIRHELWHIKQSENGTNIASYFSFGILHFTNPLHAIEEWNATSYAKKGCKETFK